MMRKAYISFLIILPFFPLFSLSVPNVSYCYSPSQWIYSVSANTENPEKYLDENVIEANDFDAHKIDFYWNSTVVSDFGFRINIIDGGLYEYNPDDYDIKDDEIESINGFTLGFLGQFHKKWLNLFYCGYTVSPSLGYLFFEDSKYNDMAYLLDFSLEAGLDIVNKVIIGVGYGYRIMDTLKADSSVDTEYPTLFFGPYSELRISYQF